MNSHDFQQPDWPEQTGWPEQIGLPGEEQAWTAEPGEWPTRVPTEASALFGAALRETRETEAGGPRCSRGVNGRSCLWVLAGHGAPAAGWGATEDGGLCRSVIFPTLHADTRHSLKW